MSGVVCEKAVRELCVRELCVREVCVCVPSEET